MRNRKGRKIGLGRGGGIRNGNEKRRKDKKIEEKKRGEVREDFRPGYKVCNNR